MMLGIILGPAWTLSLLRTAILPRQSVEIVRSGKGDWQATDVIGIIIAVWLYREEDQEECSDVRPGNGSTGFTAAMIRFGNLMNHEIYGGPTNLPWGFRFIDNVGLWMRGAEPIYTEPSHPTQIYEALFYLVVFAITMHMYWKTNARERQGLILGVGIALIFIARFFIEFVKNVQVDSEEAMRENTGLILGQWLSIPFIVWGIWLIWQAFRRKPEPVTQKKSLDYNQNVKPKK